MHRRMRERRLTAMTRRRRGNLRRACVGEAPAQGEKSADSTSRWPSKNQGLLHSAAASTTAPSSPVRARSQPSLSSDSKISTSTCDTSDTDAAGSEDGTSSATSATCGPLPPPPPPAKVTFNPSVRVRFIPSRLDMAAAGILEDTFWSHSDFRQFRGDFVARARDAGLLPQAPGVGACMLSIRGDALLLTVEPDPAGSEGDEVLSGMEGENGGGDDVLESAAKEPQDMPQEAPQVLREAIPEEEEPPVLRFQETGTGTAVEGGGGGAPTLLPRSSVRHTRGKAAPGVDGSERGSGGLLGSLLGRSNKYHDDAEDDGGDSVLESAAKEPQGIPQEAPQVLRGAIPEEKETPPVLWFQATGTGTAVEGGGGGALTLLPRSSVRHTRGKAAPGVDGSERGSGGLLGSLLGRVLA